MLTTTATPTRTEDEQNDYFSDAQRVVVRVAGREEVARLLEVVEAVASELLFL